MIFVIPSLSRIDTLKNKSLHVLRDVPKSQIYIFVVKEEYEDYRKSLDPLINVIIGPLGLHHMRNFIRLYFPEGTKMVCMDDDIAQLCIMKENALIEDRKKAARYPLFENNLAFLEDAFETLEATGLTFFGIYPVKNGYFMKTLPYKSTDLRFCVGTFWGCINDHSADLMLNIEEKEDFERTLLYYKRDKGVLRFNTICADTKYYKEKGGLQSRGLDRKETSKISCGYLIATFPEYCKLYTSKKSGIHEVRLKKN
jgi:hypothetical protein